MQQRSRGHTLLEVIVILSVFFVALTVVSGLLSYGVRMYRLSENRGEAHESRLRSVNDLREDLARSERCGNSLTYPSGNPASGDLAYSVISPLDDNGVPVTEPTSGLPVYQAHKIYFRDATTDTLRLVRRPLGVATPVASPLSPAEIQNAVTTFPAQSLVEEVLTFQVLEVSTDQPTDVTGNPQLFYLVQEGNEGATLSLRFSVKLNR